MLVEFLRQMFAKYIPLRIRVKIYSIFFPDWKKKSEQLLRWLKYLDEPELFSGQSSVPDSLFKKFVYVVHLEISSYCNRACPYCPNHDLDFFRKKKNLLSEELFLKCLKELHTVNYDKFIEFNGFNEPLYDREIFLKRAKQVKHYLPQCHLVINTNCDYLTEEYLREISSAGVDYLCITLHLTEKECLLTDSERYEKFTQFLLKMSGIRFECHKNTGTAVVGSMKIFLQLSNYDTNGHNWGSSIGNVSCRRVEPCFVPAKHVYVDYQGRVNLCCSVNMDCSWNSDFCVGNAEKKSLFEIYAGEKAAAIRSSLMDMLHVPRCCENCTGQRNYVHDSRYIDTLTFC